MRTLPRSTSTVRVRYAETDKMGVVYYANYFVWFEVARTDWLRAHGWTYRAMEDEGVFLPVIEADCTYRRPARYDDEIDVRAEVTGEYERRGHRFVDLDVAVLAGDRPVHRIAHTAIHTPRRVATSER